MAADNLNGILQIVFRILAASWWIVLPLVLLFIFLDFWLMTVRRGYMLKIKWKLLEIKIPREILKTPKAMEQVFAAAHAIYSGKMKFWDKWWKGKVDDWMSFELVGNAGKIHFYIRVAEPFRNLLESAIYAQYPDVEIVESEDYDGLLPSILPDKVYDVWGTNFILARENAYPIRTYPYFEEKVEEQRLDPIAAITETISKLKEDEMIWLQFLIRPTGDEWKKEGEKITDKLIGRKADKERTLLEELGEFFLNLIKAPAVHPVWSEENKESSPAGPLTPGEKDVIKAVEEKISKLGFEAALRFVYIDKADAFTRSNVSAIQGALWQFNTQNLNAFKADGSVTTKADFPFKAQKIFYRKRRIFDGYKARSFPKKFSIFNTEELATVYHFPTTSVEAPTLHRLESRRGEPPAELPIVE
ncbi:MAG: hypothetical protein Q8N22_01440 [bacterium]|nr:hypothetical protein [bacterium]